MWPGKVCAFCNLSERSELGQGEMLRLEVGADFEAARQRSAALPASSSERLQSAAANAGAMASVAAKPAPASAATTSLAVVVPSSVKKPRLTLKGGRRSSSFDTQQQLQLSEQQEELNSVGYADEPDLLTIVEPCGYFYAHR